MRKITPVLVLAGLCASFSQAKAQSEPTSGPVVTEPTPPPPTPTPTPGPPPATGDNYPQGNTLGIGVGYVFPANILTPNTASVRARLAFGLTLEALAVFSIDSSEDTFEDVANNLTITSTTDVTDITLAVQARYPLATRGPFQFVILGQPQFDLTNQTVDPDVDDANNEIRTETRAFTLNWGIGIDWFFRQNWSLSLSALNPLLVAASTDVEDQNNQTNTDSSDFSAGLIFAPTISALVHLYF